VKLGSSRLPPGGIRRWRSICARVGGGVVADVLEDVDAEHAVK
jgi:hypothetical protein